MPTSRIITGAIIALHIPPAPNRPQKTGSSERFGFGLITVVSLPEQCDKQDDHGDNGRHSPEPFDDWLWPHFLAFYNDVRRFWSQFKPGFGMKQCRRKHDQVQDHNDRVLQKTDKTGPGFRAVFEGKNTVQ